MTSTKSQTTKSNPSFILNSPGNVTYADRPIPEIKDSSDVIVEVKYTGICGSDVHYWHDGRIGSFVVEKPMVLGHESAGIIHSLGPDASSDAASLKEGDRVAIEPGIPCRRCVRCKDGQYNLCAQMSFAATPPIDGTLCRYYRVPVDFCYKLPEHVSLEEGALVEPTSVAVHVVKQADVRPGSSVVVFGAGPVGLLCLAVARAFGASKVVTVDINEERVKFAENYAATASFRPQKGESPEESTARLNKECGLRDGADVAIDASGAEVCMQQAVHCLRMGGVYVQAGLGKPEVAWPIAEMVSKELTVKGSFRYGPGDWTLALDMISSGRVKIKQLISKKVKFEDAEEAFGDTKAAKGIKILIAGPE